MGTARYCSVNTHMTWEQSRRDDLESIGYILMYLLRGILPWQNIKAVKTDKYTLIGQRKKMIITEQLCHGFPVEFSTYLNLVKALDFEEEPKYSEYRHMFKALFDRLGYSYDNIYDWHLKNSL